MAIEVLFLVRHAKAEASHPEGDAHRALSQEGRDRIDALAPVVWGRGFRFELALASPYLRAVQTRDLFIPPDWPCRRETTTALAPDADPLDTFEELREWESAGFTRIAVFTHNPFVTHLAGLLLASGSGPDPVFHTPTVLALGFDHGLKPHAGEPLWIQSP